MILIDAHEDLAWNMISFDRDYTRAAEDTRRREAGSVAVHEVGDSLLGWPDYQRGQVAVVFGTLFAAPARKKAPNYAEPTYLEADDAHRLYWEQLELYHRLADDRPDRFRLVESQSDLHTVLEDWRSEPDPEAEHPVGIVPLMEGAEGVRSPGELEEWWGMGLRLIGLAWAGNRFSGGTNEPGPLTGEGAALLEAMSAYGFGLDASHMDEQALLSALDRYPGAICASHSNAAALLKGMESNRHLSDRALRGLIERQAVIGVVMVNSFLRGGWRKGDPRELVSLERAADQIDYICQMAGDARHVGIGSDFDGGFGLQSVPPEIDTIADLQKLAPLLHEKGYSEADVAAIFYKNWERFLKRVLPPD